MYPNTRTGERASLRFRTAVLFAAVALLAGCNSGGGGGAVAITQQNSLQAAGAGYQGAGRGILFSTAGAAGASGLTSAVVTSGARWPNLARFAKQQFATLTSFNYGAAANLAPAVVLSAKDFPCDTPPSGGTAGSLSVSYNDADNSGTLTTGDTQSATFSNCYSLLDGTTINGGFSLAALTISGTPSLPLTPWRVSATFTVTNLQFIDSSGNYTVNGAFSYSGNTTDGVLITASFTGSSLTVRKASGPQLTLTNFNLVGTGDNNTTAYSEYGSGRIADPDLGGYVNFKTPSSASFKGVADFYPNSGSMTVTGANNSSVKLTAIDSTNVRLQVDTNGDGVVDYTVIKPWSSVQP